MHLGLCSELVSMMKNDLGCMLPDPNGIRVCELAIRELSHFAVLVVDEAEAEQRYLNIDRLINKQFF